MSNFHKTQSRKISSPTTSGSPRIKSGHSSNGAAASPTARAVSLSPNMDQTSFQQRLDRIIKIDLRRSALAKEFPLVPWTAVADALSQRTIPETLTWPEYQVIIVEWHKGRSVNYTALLDECFTRDEECIRLKVSFLEETYGPSRNELTCPEICAIELAVKKELLLWSQFSPLLPGYSRERAHALISSFCPHKPRWSDAEVKYVGDGVSQDLEAEDLHPNLPFRQLGIVRQKVTKMRNRKSGHGHSEPRERTAKEVENARKIERIISTDLTDTGIKRAAQNESVSKLIKDIQSVIEERGGSREVPFTKPESEILRMNMHEELTDKECQSELVFRSWAEIEQKKSELESVHSRQSKFTNRLERLIYEAKWYSSMAEDSASRTRRRRNRSDVEFSELREVALKAPEVKKVKTEDEETRKAREAIVQKRKETLRKKQEEKEQRKLIRKVPPRTRARVERTRSGEKQQIEKLIEEAAYFQSISGDRNSVEEGSKRKRTRPVFLKPEFKDRHKLKLAQKQLMEQKKAQKLKEQVPKPQRKSRTPRHTQDSSSGHATDASKDQSRASSRSSSRSSSGDSNYNSARESSNEPITDVSRSKKSSPENASPILSSASPVTEDSETEKELMDKFQKVMEAENSSDLEEISPYDPTDINHDTEVVFEDRLLFNDAISSRILFPARIDFSFDVSEMLKPGKLLPVNNTLAANVIRDHDRSYKSLPDSFPPFQIRNRAGEMVVNPRNIIHIRYLLYPQHTEQFILAEPKSNELDPIREILKLFQIHYGLFFAYSEELRKIIFEDFCQAVVESVDDDDFAKFMEIIDRWNALMLELSPYPIEIDPKIDINESLRVYLPEPYSFVLDIKDSKLKTFYSEVTAAGDEARKNDNQSSAKVVQRKMSLTLKSPLIGRYQAHLPEVFVSRYRHLRPMSYSVAFIESLAYKNSISRYCTHQLLMRAYTRIVSPSSKKLRSYKAFSAEVYGELLPSFVSEVLTKIDFKPNQKFYDLGSGVGNTTLQAALEFGAERSGGCEMMDHASRLTSLQEIFMQKQINLFGLKSMNLSFALDQSFVDNKKVKKECIDCDVVLVNNYLFEFQLNFDVGRLLYGMKPGSKIISLKSFIPPRYKSGGEETILDYLKVERFEMSDYCSVSWTANKVPYYISTVQPEILEEYKA